MATTLKLTAIGTSTGVVLPKELLNRLHVEKGDLLRVEETREGLLLAPYDAEVQRQMEAGERFMNEYRDVFKALADA